jgi:hypothetical protein
MRNTALRTLAAVGVLAGLLACPTFLGWEPGWVFRTQVPQLTPAPAGRGPLDVLHADVLDVLLCVSGAALVLSLIFYWRLLRSTEEIHQVGPHQPAHPARPVRTNSAAVTTCPGVVAQSQETRLP